MVGLADETRGLSKIDRGLGDADVAGGNEFAGIEGGETEWFVRGCCMILAVVCDRDREPVLVAELVSPAI